MAPELSIVIPVYNEEDVLPLLAARLRPVADGLGATYEVLTVDDGSDDLSPAVLQRMARDWPQLRIVRLRANAGHQAAISAGLASARGDYVVTLDADLQDPPEVIPEMLAQARAQRADVVYGVRSDRSQRLGVQAAQRQGLLPGDPHPVGHPRPGRRRRLPADVTGHGRRDQLTARAPPGAAVRRPDARVPLDVGDLPPRRARSRQVEVPAVQDDPAVPRQRDRLLDRSPARGHLARAARRARRRFALLAYALVASALGHTLPGWTSTVVAVAGVGAVQLLCVGILGEYVGRMYSHLQARPTYFVAYDSLTGPVTPADEPAPSDVTPGIAFTGR